MRRSLLVVLGVLLSMAGVSAAQDATCSSVVVPVVAYELRVPGAAPWKAADFAVTAGKKPLPVKSLDYGVFPRSTAILLDRSSSMSEERKWKAALEVADLIANGAPAGPLMLASFDTDVSPLEDLRAQKRPSIAAPTFQGVRTATRDAVFKMLDTMPRVGPEDTILVVTDGGENASKTGGRKRFPKRCACGEFGW